MWFVRHNQDFWHTSLSSSMLLSAHCTYALIPYHSTAQTDPSRVQGNFFGANSNGQFSTLLDSSAIFDTTDTFLPSFCHLVNKYLLSANYSPSAVLRIRNSLFCWSPGRVLLLLWPCLLSLKFPGPPVLSSMLGSSPVFLSPSCALASPAIHA